MNEKYRTLFEPFKINKLEIKNKFFMAPMNEWMLRDLLKFNNEYAQIYNLGDGKKVRNIRAAIWDAYEVARSL